MNGEHETRTGFAAWVETHPVETVVGGLAVLGLLAFLISSLGGDEPVEQLLSTPTTSVVERGTTSTSEAVIVGDVDRPDVPQLNCATLITSDEADAAIFGDTDGPRGLFTFSQGETCAFDPDDGSGAFVTIEPGSPDDIASGGQDVDGVGDTAAWSDDAVTGSGALTVGVNTDLGALIYRIRVSRPDLDGSDRLEIARELALAALPRFPGVTIDEPEVERELVTFSGESPDLSIFGLEDALYEGVDSGEWSLGDGLAVILRSMVDGIAPDLVDGDLAETSGSPVIAAAREYATGGFDDSGQVQQLLDKLYRTDAELDRLAPAETAALSPLVVAAAVFLQDSGEQCGTSADNPCYSKISMDGFDDIESDHYLVYVALPSKWTQTEVELAKQALHDSAVVFEALGDMPPTALILEPGDNLYALHRPSEGCRTMVGDFLVGRDADELKQILAREISLCLIENEAYEQLFGNPNPVR